MRRIHLADGYSAHICVLRPESRGSVGLQDANPASPPRIDPNFLSDPRDLQTLMAGVRIMERAMAAPPLAPWRGKRLYPHDGTDAGIEADGELGGLDVTLTRQILRGANLEPEFRNLPWARALHLMARQQLDVAIVVHVVAGAVDLYATSSLPLLGRTGNLHAVIGIAINQTCCKVNAPSEGRFECKEI